MEFYFQLCFELYRLGICALTNHRIEGEHKDHLIQPTFYGKITF